jgi:transposase InsO family protein
MIAFIDDHRGAHGVEPICKVLPIAPSTYHAHVAKRRDPAKLSARARQDAALKIDVWRVFEENFRVYGVRKVWRQLKREGFDVARCTVSRLMRDMGLQGVILEVPVVPGTEYVGQWVIGEFAYKPKMRWQENAPGSGRN